MNLLHVTIGMYLCASCGGATRLGHPAADANAADNRAAEVESVAGIDGVDSDGRMCRLSAGGSLRIPQEHRAASENCPAERGSVGPIDVTGCGDVSGVLCKNDADCMAGRNGRCLMDGSPCRTYCSYDQCSTDADCPEKQPCICRGGGPDTTANYCLAGSNCATDADCGECGFCSLSLQRANAQCTSVDGCPEDGCDGGGTGMRCACVTTVSFAYICHTSKDECTNDSDCAFDYCAYMDRSMRWECGSCVPKIFM
jgi:hypothetical protein